MADWGFRGILKSASIVGAGMIFSRAIGLLAETIVARQLAAAEFGAAIFAYTTLLTLGGIALIGIPQGFAYYLAIFDQQGEHGAAVRTVISGVSILSVVVGLTFACIYLIPFSIVESIGISRDQWRWFRLLAPLIIVYPLSRMSFGIMRGYDMSVPKVLSDDVVNKLVAFICLGVAIWQGATEWIFASFFLGQYIIGGFLAGLYVIYLLRVKVQDIELGRSFRDEATQLVSYSWPLAFKNATRRILGNTDILLIGTLLASSSAVGFYRAGFVISQLGMISLTAITYLYTPRIARRSDSGDVMGMNTLYQRATKWSTLLTLPLIVPLFFYSSSVITFLFGASYQAGQAVLMILTIDVLLRVGLGPASATLQGINRTKPDFLSAAATTFVNFGVSYYLVLEFGIVGAALGTLLSMVFLNLIQVTLVYHYTSMIPYTQRYLTGVLAILISAIPIYLLTNHLFDKIVLGNVGLPVAVPIFTLLFLFVEFLIYWFGGLATPSEKQQIRETVYSKRFEVQQ